MNFDFSCSIKKLFRFELWIGPNWANWVEFQRFLQAATFAQLSRDSYRINHQLFLHFYLPTEVPRQQVISFGQPSFNEASLAK